MTLTPERIKETEKSVADRPKDLQYITPDYLAELCRLARLGLRVEGARVADPFPAMGLVDQHLLTGKRVALVVLEDSE